MTFLDIFKMFLTAFAVVTGILIPIGLFILALDKTDNMRNR